MWVRVGEPTSPSPGQSGDSRTHRAKRANGGVDCDPRRRLRRYATQSRQDRRAAAPGSSACAGPGRTRGPLRRASGRWRATALVRRRERCRRAGPCRPARGRAGAGSERKSLIPARPNRDPAPGCAPPRDFPAFVHTILAHRASRAGSPRPGASRRSPASHPSTTRRHLVTRFTARGINRGGRLRDGPRRVDELCAGRKELSCNP